MQTRAITTRTKAPIAVVQQSYLILCAAETPAEIASSLEPPVVVYVSDLQQTTVPTYSAPDDWRKFQALVADWKAERSVMSSINESVLCPAYQRIIGMGDIAVPFLIAQLESEGDDPDQWFWALKSITGDDPVPPDDRGDFQAMARGWIEWARDHGYAR